MRTKLTGILGRALAALAAVYAAGPGAEGLLNGRLGRRRRSRRR